MLLVMSQLHVSVVDGDKVELCLSIVAHYDY